MIWFLALHPLVTVTSSSTVTPITPIDGRASHRRLLLGEGIPHHPNHCQTNHRCHNFSVHFVFFFF
jgi:hypothetical protein